ncbi:Uncharacterised protein [Yersinia pseudotuberculosis]|uniref:Uncharacterized protein n=1 Tax=Yersinia pseudotuberculosis TaxID=633 RepID=A0A380Q4L7_YERPU|nr:Uncharacterised protein [Yersinia pseudotuberculosis]
MIKLIINAPFGNIKLLVNVELFVNLELFINLEDGGLIGYRPHQMMMKSKRIMMKSETTTAKNKTYCLDYPPA